MNAEGARLSIDGVYGSQTAGAVADFQRGKGLSATGGMTDATWVALLPRLGRYYTGDAVSALQRILNEHGAQLPVNGSFGPMTQEAVLAFQSDKGITVDGWVGPDTWARLLR